MNPIQKVRDGDESEDRHGSKDDLPPELEYTEAGKCDTIDGMAEYAVNYTEEPSVATPYGRNSDCSESASLTSGGNLKNAVCEYPTQSANVTDQSKGQSERSTVDSVTDELSLRKAPGGTSKFIDNTEGNIHPEYSQIKVSETSDRASSDPNRSLDVKGRVQGETLDDVSLNRQELKEPDGASGPSSAPSSPLPVASRDIQETQPLLKQGGTKSKANDTSTGSFVTMDDITPAEQKIDRTETPSIDSKIRGADTPYIPNTNIAVACLVTLCFNLPLGALAIYFSLMAAKAYRDQQPKTGAKRAKISIYISLFSIVLSVLIVMAVVLYLATQGQMRQRRYTGKTSINF